MQDGNYILDSILRAFFYLLIGLIVFAAWRLGYYGFSSADDDSGTGDKTKLDLAQRWAMGMAAIIFIAVIAASTLGNTTECDDTSDPVYKDCITTQGYMPTTEEKVGRGVLVMTFLAVPFSLGALKKYFDIGGDGDGKK